MRGAIKDQASSICDSCGEAVVLPINVPAGPAREDVEDWSVCGRPTVMHVKIEEGGGGPATE